MPKYLYPASTSVAKLWLKRAGISAGGVVTGGGISFLLKFYTKTLPAGSVDMQFVYVAICIAIFGAIPLLLHKAVVCVGFAQLGIATSYIYMAYAVRPLFTFPLLRIVLITLIICIFLIFFLLFGQGARFMFIHGSMWDRIGAVVFLTVFAVLAIVPSPNLLR